MYLESPPRCADATRDAPPSKVRPSPARLHSFDFEYLFLRPNKFEERDVRVLALVRFRDRAMTRNETRDARIYRRTSRLSLASHV
jgi:hypothetical protein